MDIFLYCFLTCFCHWLRMTTSYKRIWMKETREQQAVTAHDIFQLFLIASRLGLLLYIFVFLSYFYFVVFFSYICIICRPSWTVNKYYYSVFQKKQAVWCLIITLANVDRFSKLFYRVIRKNIFYVPITEISTSPAICWYTTLWKSKIQKCYQTFTLNMTIDMFNKNLMWDLK